jgi:60 kDa SS-A/Ro ribonucleoprotein
LSENLPLILQGFELAKKATDVKDVVRLIKEYKLPRECVPTQFLTDAKVWEALLPTMPLTALVRNLGNMTKSGLLTATSEATKTVISKLSDADYIRKSRVHPIAILIAMKTYASGTGFKGSNTWTPVPKIISTLDAAFYKAFDNVEATGKNYFIGLDVSSSMRGQIFNSCLTHSEAAAALAMTVMKTEPAYYIYGFKDRITDLKLDDSMSLNTVLQKTSNLTLWNRLFSSYVLCCGSEDGH